MKFIHNDWNSYLFISLSMSVLLLLFIYFRHAIQFIIYLLLVALICEGMYNKENFLLLKLPARKRYWLLFHKTAKIFFVFALKQNNIYWLFYFYFSCDLVGSKFFKRCKWVLLFLFYFWLFKVIMSSECFCFELE